jgi:hypothetical protein
MQAPVITRTHWFDRQVDGGCLRGQRRALERVAVHRGIVMRRNVDRRHDIGGEHAVERVAQCHAFDGRDRCGPLANNGLCGRNG